MKNNWLLIGAVAVGAYLIYKKMKKNTENGKEIAPPPVKPVKPSPSVRETENTISENI
jgi:hypothetical protein